MKIQLGDKVKDSVTGFTGIAVGVTNWLHGCSRVIVQPEGVTKEGKTYENQSFDEPQLIIIKAKKVPKGATNTGGPRQEISYKETPKQHD